MNCKIMFIFEKIDKNVQLNTPFLENFQSVYLFPLKAGGFFLSEDWKLSVWSSVLFTVFAL